MPSLEDLTVDQLLAHAKSTEGDAQLLRTLTKNPETREMIQRAIKKANPNISIPEIDAADRVTKRVDELAADNVKLRNEMQERDIRARIEAERASVKSKYKLSDEDVKGVEALMIDKENPIPSYDAAARVFCASRESAVPTPANFQPPVYTMPSDEIWKKGIGNPMELNKIALQEAYKVYSETHGGRAH